MPSPPPTALDAAAFRAACPQVLAWIRDEWPGLDPAGLEAAGDDADAVVELVAAHLDCTRARARRLLAELLALATEPTQPRAPRAAARPRPDPRDAEPRPLDPFERLVLSLEGHLDELAQQVRTDVAPLAADTARKHLGLSLLLAGGIGLVIGLLLGAMGYGAEEEVARRVDDPDREAPRGDAG